MDNRLYHEATRTAWRRRLSVDEADGTTTEVCHLRVDSYSRFRPTVYNRTFFVYPDGHYDTYDKRHLFAYGGESECYTPGTKQTIAEYKGFRIMIATCYDLRFPVWLRNTTDYDALIVVANWPQNRHDMWQTLLKARAIENQCFAIGCNRTGKDPYCDYIGGSAVIDAKGRTVGQARTGIEDVLTADIELESLHTFRSKFNVLADKDPFMLI